MGLYALRGTLEHKKDKSVKCKCGHAPPVPHGFVRGQRGSSTICKRDRSYNASFTCGDMEPETRPCCVTIIMILTKEFTYNYNLNTDSLQEVIT